MDPHPAPRRLTPLRVLGLCLYAGLLTANGWLDGWALALDGSAGSCGNAGQRPCGASDIWTFLALPGCCVLTLVVLIGTFTVTAGDSTEAERQLPVGAGLLVGLACLLLGVSWHDRSTSPWIFGPAAVIALLALLVARREERTRARTMVRERQSAERARRLDRHGLTVLATVLDLRGTGDDSYDRPALVLTVRYSTADGQEFTEPVTRSFPAYDAPRRGDRVHIRYDPELPGLPVYHSPYVPAAEPPEDEIR